VLNSPSLEQGSIKLGVVAQLGARLNGIQKVRGSNPLNSTRQVRFGGLFCLLKLRVWLAQRGTLDRMTTSTLERLGFSASDRVVILHADDIGMCHATIPAFEKLLAFGLVSSYAVMAPCPWASAAMKVAVQTNADVGVHLTLTSEWQHYRWSPLSTRNTASGLLDAAGFFPRSCPEVQNQANPQAVLLEFQAQFAYFAAHGVVPTHADTHMLSAFHPKFLETYVKVALESVTPILFPTQQRYRWMNEAASELAMSLEPTLHQNHFPTIDHVNGLPLSNDPNSQDNIFEVRLETAKNILGQLEPGITHFAFHPAVDTPELRDICPDWRSRVGDALVFYSPELRQFLADERIQVIGYKALKNLIL
jgi:chitin disaccharide deacetylase